MPFRKRVIANMHNLITTENGKKENADRTRLLTKIVNFIKKADDWCNGGVLQFKQIILLPTLGSCGSIFIAIIPTVVMCFF